MKSNNFLYFTMGILVVAVGLLGYAYLAEQDSSEVNLSAGDKEISLDIDDNGISGTFKE